jgi:predicted flap endonuclease-1-like 5' DNA nuclease
MSDEIPLKRIEGITHDQIHRLSGHWITSVQQLVGVATTTNGIGALSQILALDERGTREMIEQARGLLDPEERVHLSTPADTSRYGLGAAPPPKPDE